MSNNCAHFLLSVLFLSLYTGIAVGEGGNKRTSGNWGVNRRVVTGEGYRQVGGTVTMTNTLPPLGGQRITWSRFQSMPTFYLGGTGRYIIGDNQTAYVDTGLQFDYIKRRLYRDKDTSATTTGWWIFFEILTGKLTNQRTSTTRYDTGIQLPMPQLCG